MKDTLKNWSYLKRFEEDALERGFKNFMRLLKFVHYRSASRQDDDCVIHNGDELPEANDEQQRLELA